METRIPKTLHYKRSRFVTHLPVDYLYSPSHCWIARQEDDLWRVGFTKFAVRMLGDMVDHGFEIEPGALVQPGQDRKSTRLNSSHRCISYAVFCLKKKKKK